MDIENRKKAEFHMRKARNKKICKDSTNRILDSFFKAANYYEAIVHKKEADIHQTAMAYNEIAILYFNRKDYQSSGEYCNKAIRQYIEMSDAPTDKHLRHLSELYVDFSDICMHLMRESEAHTALMQSIRAFKLIKEKTMAEQAIGDPEKNFIPFRTYMEKKLCDQSYLKSAEYCNHEILLSDANEEIQMMGMFSAIALTEMQDYCNQITDMMKNMTLSLAQFTIIDFNNPLDDNNYRAMAVNLLRLTQGHVKNNDLSYAMDTYLQAKDALKKIGNKTGEDRKIIQSIKNQITLLNTRQDSQELLEEQNQQASGTFIATLGLFSGHPQNSPTPEAEVDFQDKMEF